MDDLNFRAEFHRALDPIAPPAPWLAAAVRDNLRRRRREARRLGSRTRRPQRPAWLLPALAALLLIALVVGLLVGSHILRLNTTIPVRPPQHGAAGPPGCPGWGTNSASGGSSPSDRMTTFSIGWANGALRTTDRGAHWDRVAPDDMFADAPKGTDHNAYPPAYVDFFLDSTHAWIAYGYPSATSCFDHVTVFSTSDGGATWKRSSPVSPAIQADTGLLLQLDFLDAKRGWLMVLASGRIAPDWFVYATTDGGLNWQPVSQLPPVSSFCGVEFKSPTVGFLGDCLNTAGPTATLTTTKDGGKSWTAVRLPQPPGSLFTVTSPVFFDQLHGIIHINAETYQGNTSTPSDYLAVTDDGGQTWSLLPRLPVPGYAQAFFFLDRSHFYVLVSSAKGDVATLYRSIDGGMTWYQVGNVAPVPNNPKITFIDPQHGFIEVPSQAIGKAPDTLSSTADGGRTWKDMHPQLS